LDFITSNLLTHPTRQLVNFKERQSNMRTNLALSQTTRQLVNFVTQKQIYSLSLNFQRLRISRIARILLSFEH